ncbi:valine--tRNA ligase [Mucisphaera calidilacus]|uniref:Valine--tRNA ligase n=1 Tax=Mucisphaera calidilacus TaxID=2527982 RepID=A0A518BTB7_9BACT|nr:valine--tRNA ligase [Mucisphaera calidilacus]QDU70223.1 Valine--tRNA ligase [Mucisphaera calidilacus]
MSSSTTAQLPPAYNPADVEKSITARWASARAGHAEPGEPGPAYSVVIPPPNVTAALHLGHALNNTLQDVLVRFHRMMGFNTLWMPGTDHAGIATQTVVDKRLQQSGEPALKDYKRQELEGRGGREAFIGKVQAWKDEYEERITEQLREMGCSCDWDRQRFTMDPVCAKAVREAFFRLFRDGLIYRGKRLVNWDPVSQTALADDEVEMQEVDGNFWYMKYPVVDDAGHETGEYATVATTRPETMLGDTAVAVNPNDGPRAAMIGRKVRLPIVGRVIPIIADDYVVIPDEESDDSKARMASGFLKVTPAHDPNDWEIGQRHGLDVINVMAPDASISIEHGWPAEEKPGENEDLKPLIGLSREAARKAIVRWFKERDLLAEVKPYRHAVGHSYRSHVPVEPYLSDQWYVKVTAPELAGRALQAMDPAQRCASEGVVWSEDHPFETPVAGTWRKATGDADALETSLSQYPHEAYSIGSEGEDLVVRINPGWEDRLEINELNELMEQQGFERSDRATGMRFHPARYAKTFQTWHENIRDWCISRQLWWGHRIPVWSRETVDGSIDERLKAWEAEGRVYVNRDAVVYVCVHREDDDEVVKAIEAAGFERDPDVLDTWFSSALWPMSTMGWPEPEGDTAGLLERYNPTSVLCTAREIITLWVSRMVMFNLYFLGRLPFDDVFIHAMIQDGHGQKMSKSLGNGVDPMDIIHSHGADAMRYTLTAMTTQTQDVRMPVDMVDPHSGETFTPKYVTGPGGVKVAAPEQESPADKSKKMVSSYGVASGKASPSDAMPLARNTSEKFDIGQRFSNKLWNACRFALGYLHATTTEGELGELGLADRWILSRFARATQTATAQLRAYEFAPYATTLYDLVWRDLCDWYIEAVKPTVKENVTQQRVLAACFDASLRLLHPSMPFVTERLFEALNDVVPERSLPGVALPSGELLARAAWPEFDASVKDEGAEGAFEVVRSVVGSIREMRTANKVPPREVTRVSLRASGDELALVTDHLGLILGLANSEAGDVGAGVARPGDAASAVLGGIEVYVHGVLDVEAERARLSKRVDDLTKQVGNFKGRLSNEKYVNNAPEKLVQETRDQLAAAEAELAKVREQFEALG